VVTFNTASHREGAISRVNTSTGCPIMIGDGVGVFEMEVEVEEVGDGNEVGRVAVAVGERDSVGRGVRVVCGELDGRSVGGDSLLEEVVGVRVSEAVGGRVESGESEKLGEDEGVEGAVRELLEDRVLRGAGENVL